MISTDERDAAERLLTLHQRYEDTDTDENGQKVYFEACAHDDDDWPCDTVRVAEALLDATR